MITNKADADPVEVVDLHGPLLEALDERSAEEAARALRWRFEGLRRMVQRGNKTT